MISNSQKLAKLQQKPKSYLITGWTRFIGFYLADVLLAQGNIFVAIDDHYQRY